MSYVVLPNCPTRFLAQNRRHRFSHFLVFVGMAAINLLILLLGLPLLMTLLIARRFRAPIRS